jgi:hypothetical protein
MKDFLFSFGPHLNQSAHQPTLSPYLVLPFYSLTFLLINAGLFVFLSGLYLTNIDYQKVKEAADSTASFTTAIYTHFFTQ